MVEVLDINDNRPEFGQPEYSFTVYEVCHNLYGRDDLGETAVFTFHFPINTQ